MTGTYERAVQAALRGPEARGLKIHGHELDVRPVSRARADGLLFAHGQILHGRGELLEERVHYTITVRNGRVLHVDERVDRGGQLTTIFDWSAMARAAETTFNPALGASLASPSSTLAGAVIAAEEADAGDWEDACTDLIGVIAAALAEEQRAALAASGSPAGSAVRQN